MIHINKTTLAIWSMSFLITASLNAESPPTRKTASVEKSATLIKNNSIWKDTDGNTIWASLGGHISKFGDTYYWVGTDPRKTDASIRLYSSKTLGSNTWKLEGFVDKRAPSLG
jgi:hypothetical protein